MIKVNITYPDGTHEFFKAEEVDYSSGWITLTIVNDEDKLQRLSLPNNAVRSIEEIEYYE